MRIAFYAPMKPPDDPEPSGDRRMATSLIRALETAGHTVRLAARQRSYDGTGDPVAQRRNRRVGAAIASEIARQPGALFDGPPPELWFTYHLYHKAPDWIGPLVARRLGIPYVIAEASHAPKQADGRWRLGHGAAAAAIRRARHVIVLNPVDVPCLRRLRGDSGGITPLAPFLALPATPGADRTTLARRFGLDAGRPWLLCVAMMRPGAKLASYQGLGAALRQLTDRPWQLLVAGDGPARAAVERALPGDDRAAYLGILGAGDIAALGAAADLFVWPAVREGYGMALLEAQAAGLPVVAGHTPGVAQIVADGITGLLTPAGDAPAFAAAVATLLDDADRRRAMGAAARHKAATAHDIASAARYLDNILQSLVRNSLS